MLTSEESRGSVIEEGLRGEEVESAPMSFKTFRTDGFRMGIATRWIEDPGVRDSFKSAIRSCQGIWINEIKQWIVPLRATNKLFSRLEEIDKERFPASIAHSMLSEAETEPYAFAQFFEVVVCRTSSGKSLVRSRYDALIASVLRQELFSDWYAGTKSWLSRNGVDSVIERLEKKAGINRENIVVPVDEMNISFVLDSSDGGAQMDAWLGKVKKVEGSGPGVVGKGSAGFMLALTSPLKSVPVASNVLQMAEKKYGLFDFQVEGVKHLLSHSSALLADDMGLGKTRQAIVASILTGGKILVVCPASLKRNWKREIESVDKGTRVQVIETRRDALDFHAKWVVVNYETMDMFVNVKKVPFSTMILDEVHLIKETGSARTQAAFMLGARIPKKMLLTATPIMNRESEIYTLLRLSGHPLGMIDVKEFREAFSRSPETRDRLGTRVREWMLRREKDKVVRLPGKVETVLPVDVEPAMMDEYQTIIRDEGLTALVKVQKLMGIVEKMKIPFVCGWLRKLGEKGKAIVFCNRLDTVKEIGKSLSDADIGWVKLVGETPTHEREQSVRSFQSDPDIQVFVTTYQAGGVGLTLTAAEWVVLAGLPWTPALKGQAEDRANRIGQTKKVRIITPIVAKTVEESVYALLEKKKTIIQEVMGGAGLNKDDIDSILRDGAQC
ncbi:helicase-like [Leptospirillum ferriphilum]|uniref:Helicase-like n=1 Tax=Leptospirillum ferriphilum TaxID=178606 RepID=A0A094YKV3_9BACT|nr:DEAD/DEAH box helicase [Leptospirillum ferriphilum]KGA93861.1 helicase-like [Leptospirillum ferriphilum]